MLLYIMLWPGVIVFSFHVMTHEQFFSVSCQEKLSFQVSAIFHNNQVIAEEVQRVYLGVKDISTAVISAWLLHISIFTELYIVWLRAHQLKTDMPRCGECNGCLNHSDGFTCNTCKFCLDSSRLGGPSRLRTPCEMRLCVQNKKGKAMDVRRVKKGDEEKLSTAR